VHEAGCEDPDECDEVPVQPPYLHDQYLYPVELRLAAEYGVTTALGVELQVPFRVVRTTIEYTTLEGEQYEPLDPHVHHRNETVAGPADPWLLLRVGTQLDGWWLAARPGVSIPLGRTEKDPFALGDEGIRHQHIQLGSGTFDPVLVLEASGPMGPVSAGIFTQGQAALYENHHGYRAPWRVHGGFGAGIDVGAGFSVSPGVEALHEDAERWHGVVKQDGNLGRTEVLVALTLGYTFEATEFSLAFKVPVYRRIVEGDEAPGELESPLTVSLGVTHVLGE
jgi:hypothetical protein